MNMKEDISKKPKVLLGMSGGVDSSITALLLQKKGYEVIGATMQLHDYCNNDQVEDAKEVAKKLGIEHHVFNMKEQFKKHVIDYFIEEYQAGRTPNPCVACNKYIKFGATIDKAEELGIEYIATGHYARIEKVTDGNKVEYLLKKGKDERKDQSYMLYNLTQELLAKTIFPLGEYSKEEVRKIAEENGFTIANKPDSQEVCFVPDNNHFRFIQENSITPMKKGEIVNTSGEVLGYHEGSAKYTIGQRKGLGISAKTPLFVIDIDSEKNQVVLGSNDELFSKELIATNLNWITFEKLEKEMEVEAKIRYKAKESKARIYPIDDKVKVVFEKPQRAITKGQSVAFYKDDIVLGGGIIS